MHYVYAIKSCSRKYIYVGITDNITRRLKQHSRGYNKKTKAYRPFITLLVEKYPDRINARVREKYLKSGCGKEYLKNHARVVEW